MAFFQVNFISSALGIHCGVNVVMPNTPKSKKLPCLLLLHGLSDDHTVWQRHTSIERHAQNLQVAVVMPAVNRSFYLDMKNGAKYYTYVSEELPQAMRAFFPLSDQRKDNFVAGLSMGGYGALLLALRKPENFSHAASFSGATDMVEIARDRNIPDIEHVFGKKSPAGTDADLFHLARRHAAEKTRLPKLSIYCGAKDFLYQQNVRFNAELRRLGIPFDYSESPTHEHTWDYWDLCIADYLKKLPLKK